MDENELSKYSDRDLLISLHTKVGLITPSISDHEKRIRKMESDGFKIKGAVTILVFLAGLLEPVLIFFKGTHK